MPLEARSDVSESMTEKKSGFDGCQYIFCDDAKEPAVTHNHRQAVRESEQVRAAVDGRLVVKVSQNGGAAGVLGGEATFVVLEPELAGVLADNRHVVPAQAPEALSRHLAQRRREVDQVDAGEEGLNGQEGVHGLDVISRAPTNLI
jgi:hypothetical protein